MSDPVLAQTKFKDEYEGDVTLTVHGGLGYSKRNPLPYFTITHTLKKGRRLGCWPASIPASAS